MIVATGNRSKASEISAILESCRDAAGGLRVATLKDVIGFMPDINENGDTLRENARIKVVAARGAFEAYLRNAAFADYAAYADRNPDAETAAFADCGSDTDRKTYMDAIVCADRAKTIIADRAATIIADDSGLFVDCLGGRPGVRSARYAGDGASDGDRVEKLLAEMYGVPEPGRGAEFRCVIAVSYPGGEIEFTEGICRGAISFAPKGENGFGYDPIFYLPDMRRTMAELSNAQKNRVSHRGAAVMLMADAVCTRLDAIK